MRAHGRVRVKCMVSVREWVKCRVSVTVRVTFWVSVRSQEAPGTDTTAEPLSPQRAEWGTLGRVLVRSSLWVSRPDEYMGHPLGRPQESSCADAVVLWKRHGDVTRSIPSISAPILEPVCVVLSDFGIGTPWEERLSWV